MFKRTLLIMIVLLLSACGQRAIRGSGDLVTESRNASGFDRIEARGFGDVSITQDGTESLTVEADDNVMEYITTEVKGRTLELGFEDTLIVSPTRLTFSLHLKDLVGVNISGSGNIEAESIETDRLEIKISGSGDATVWTTESLDVDISGSGSVNYYGQPSVNSSTSGSGQIRSRGNK